MAGCQKAEPSRSEFVLGTVCSVTLYDRAKPRIYREIFDRFREIENRMSVNLPDTDVARVNRNAGIAPVQVHEDVFEVIESAVHYAELSDGALDPAIGPLVSLWGIGGENPQLPGKEEIDRLLPNINWRDIVLDREKSAVFLTRPGMALDLGAIAKGYAADEAAKILRKTGIPRAMIDLGGNILTYGVKKDKRPWRIGVQNPVDTRGSYIGIVETPVKSAGAKTVVTSGVYERYFETEDGTRYHHILDPQSGYPARSGLLSVSIVADRSMDADALSTATFVLGYERGRALLDSLEGVDGIFVFEDRTIRITDGMNFLLTDENYRLVSGGD